ncbi:MAG: 50S ribosomal protein L25 [Pirellulaceae bacterium]|nr:50S ribosomal protein L25 [Pirellulaceae bacterium]
MAEQLAVEPRQITGKLNNRRLRRAGKIPAILYGHGLECVSLSVDADPLEAAIRHGSRLVNLTGVVNESAFIRDLQWNTWGTQIIHVDFTRVSEHEIVEVSLKVELRGEAPGLKEGGVVTQNIHEVEIACPASAIPEKLDINVNHLKLNDKITLADLPLPQGSKLLEEDLELIVVECVVPQEMPEEEAAEAAPGEPEVIGEKAKDEEEAKES